MATSLLDVVQTHLQVNPLWRFPEQKLEIPLSDIWAISGRYAAALASLGIGKDARVGILCANCFEFVPLLLAAWRLGATAVPLRPAVNAAEDHEQYLARVDGNCGFAALIFESDNDGSTASAWSRISDAPCRSFAQIDACPDVQPPQSADIGPHDCAVIQYSSGSTGTPKGVIVTHAMVVRQVELIADGYLTRAGRPLSANASWLPFNHDMGLFIGILVPLYCGVPNVLVSPRWYLMNPPRWFKLMSQLRVGMNFTTNAAMAHSLKSLSHLSPGDVDLSGLSLYFGAEKVTCAVLRKSTALLTGLGMRHEYIHIGYGMAENALGATATKGRITVVRVDADEEGKPALADETNVEALEIASIGVAFRDTSVAVFDERGNELPDLTLGEIRVKSPCLTPGYFRNPELTGRVLQDGWLRTSDTGFTYRGEIFFHSRKDDLIIIGGRNIVPDDIEHCAEGLDDVRAGGTTLLCLNNRDSGVAELHLLVETKPIEPADARARRVAVQESVFRTFALLVNHIHFCAKGSIEKTSSGKKRRKVIRDRFLKGELMVFAQPGKES